MSKETWITPFDADDWSIDSPGESTFQWIGTPGKKTPVAAVVVNSAFGKDHILERNARLIAEAPAMYEALCKIESVIDGVMDRALKSGLMGASEWDKICSDVGREEWDLFELQRQVRDILARIEGEGE